MTTQMTIRVEEEIKTKVNQLAKAEGKNVSTVVRELLENYVKERDVSSYMEDLWNRIGADLKAQGGQPEDVGQVIREVRAGKTTDPIMRHYNGSIGKAGSKTTFI